MTLRALFITPVVPGATGNGLSMRAGQWLQALAKDFYVDVVVLPLFAAHVSAPNFTRSLAATTLVIDLVVDIEGNVDSSLPRTVPLVLESDCERVRALAQQADVVVVFRLYLAEFVDIAKSIGTPVVLDIDDLDWVREQRLGNLHESSTYMNLASQTLPLAGVICCAGVTDVSALQSLIPAVPVIHVPNGVRSDPLTISETHLPSFDLLFVGTLGYEPNATGARWLVEKVAPLIPEVRIAIVGAAPGPEVLALASESVTVAADVAEVSTWYAASTVATVPIHVGSGTRIKIPEAWAHHLPVVSTTIGAEGISDLHGALIADSPDEFAARCRALLTDSALAHSLAASGWHNFELAHSMQNALTQTHLAINTAINAPPRQ